MGGLNSKNSVHIGISIIVLASILLLYTSIIPSITGYRVKGSLDIFINENLNSNFALANSQNGFTETSFYRLNTNPDDDISLRYFREDDDNTEVVFMDLPGYENQFSIVEKIDQEKIDPSLLNEKFLIEEDYFKDGRLPVIVKLKGADVEFSSLKNIFLEEFSNTFDIQYYLIKDLDIIDSVKMDIDLTSIPALSNLTTVNKIYLDKKVEAVLDASLPLINAYDVWSLKDSKNQSITGIGVTIAVIDTGVDYTHPDLGGCFGPACKVVDGYDFVNGDADPIDDHGHGTHVAATAAGKGSLKGVAPDAKIYAYKVLSSSGTGSYSQVIDGIKRAVDPNNDGKTSDHVDIISMSLGGSGDEDSPLSLAVDEAVDKGVVVVSAAGNSGSIPSAIGTPGAARKGISVAATDDNDQLAIFSSRGPTTKSNLKPDLSAPGVNICAAQWNEWLDAKKCLDDDHIAISGTSMATPHVSGAAALLLQLHPNWSPEKIKSVLMSTAKGLNLKPWEQGAGRLDIFEATKAQIATSPASISFGLSVTDELSRDISIENIGDQDLDVVIEVNPVFDESGKQYNIASIDKSLKLKIGDNKKIKLSIDVRNLEGRFYGYVKISDGEKEYKIPYFFVKLSGLTVDVIDGEKELSPNVIGLRNDDLSVKETASKILDFTGNSYTFNIKSGNYTVYAIGDASNKTSKYIISDSVYLESGSTKTLKLDLQKTREIKIPDKDPDGGNLNFEKFGFMIKESFNQKTFSLGIIQSSPIYDEIILRLSDTKNDKLSKEISVWYSAYSSKDEILESINGADELFYLYWTFKNVSSSLPKELIFSKDELAEYKYKYNLPGGDPNIGASDYGSSYTNLGFWTNPSSFISISSWRRLALPLERTIYIKPGKFALDNYAHINYIHFPQPVKEFAAEAAQSEYDVNRIIKWPNGIIAKAGEKRILDHGTPAFIPGKFDNTQNLIKINRILKGNSKETYLTKLDRIFYSSLTDGSGFIDLPRPIVKVFVDNILGQEQKVVWDNFYYTFSSSSNPEFRVEMSIPVSYEIPKSVEVVGKFKLKDSDRNPPYLDSLDIAPRYDLGKPLNLKFLIKDDDSESVDARAYYKTGSKWNEIKLTKSNSFYFGSISVTGDSIDLNITASDGKNEIQYVFEPIAKKSHNIDLDVSASKKTAKLGDIINFNGVIKDGNQGIAQAYIKYLADGEFYDFSKSSEIKELAGTFNKNWQVPLNYTGNLVWFAVSYLGTGIYNPKTEIIKISLDVPGPALTDFYLEPPIPKAEKDATIVSIWEKADEALFESNYTGEWKNYSTEKKANKYWYIIKAYSLKENQAVGYRFLAKDSKNIWNSKMPVQTFNVKSEFKRETNIKLLNFDNGKGWGEKWNFTCSVSDSNNTDINLDLQIQNSKGVWETKETKNIEQTLNAKSVSFIISLDKEYIGSTKIKCLARDTVVVNQTEEKSITVERDDVKLEIVKGSDAKVKRQANERVQLGFKIYDKDREEYVTQKLQESEIRITKPGSDDISLKCKIEESVCLAEFDPGKTDEVGLYTFEGFISDPSYKIESIEQRVFTVIGDFVIDISKIDKKYKRGETVEIQTKVSDDSSSLVNPEAFNVEYRFSHSANEWILCGIKSISKGVYLCTIEAEKLLTGVYDLRIIATKLYYNDFKKIVQAEFKISEDRFKKHKLNQTENRRGKFQLPEINVSLDFLFKKDLFDEEINLTFTSDNPAAKNLTEFASLDKYLRIEPKESLKENLTYVEIRINYTDDEVAKKNFNESSLRISFFNATSNEWIVFEPPRGGVNTEENYVWANVTHLSDFAVGGKLSDGSSCGLNSECASGNCALDYDKDGSWCTPLNNCASEGFVNYVSGSSTCYNSNVQFCSSSLWSEILCSNGCSVGECIVPVPPEGINLGGSVAASTGAGGGSGGGGSTISSLRQCDTGDYICGEWSECLDGAQIRECKKKSAASCNQITKPYTVQTCEGEIVESPTKDQENKINEIINILHEEQLPEISDDNSEKTKKLIYIGATLLILLSLFIMIWVRLD